MEPSTSGMSLTSIEGWVMVLLQCKNDAGYLSRFMMYPREDHMVVSLGFNMGTV
jgi:hypothetical protein